MREVIDCKAPLWRWLLRFWVAGEAVLELVGGLMCRKGVGAEQRGNAHIGQECLELPQRRRGDGLAMILERLLDGQELGATSPDDPGGHQQRGLEVGMREPPSGTVAAGRIKEPVHLSRPCVTPPHTGQLADESLVLDGTPT